MKKLLLGLLAGIVLVSCGNKASEAGKTGRRSEDRKIVIGATPVPHAEFPKLVKEDLAKGRCGVGSGSIQRLHPTQINWWHRSGCKLFPT